MANDYISNENRLRIINLYLDGRTPADIASILGFKKPAVYAVLNSYKDNGLVERRLKGGPRRVPFIADQKKILQGWVDDHCGLTLQALVDRCSHELNLNVSRSTVDRALKSFNYSFERTHSIPERRNGLEVLDQRAIYADKIMIKFSQLDDTYVYYIDEVGFCISMKTRGGRSLRGTTPVHVVPGLRSRNVSVCCAMNKNGIVLYKAQTRAYNSEYFTILMQDLLRDIRDSGIHEAIFVMGNVPFYKADAIKNLINETSFELIFLPPYSPFLNPNENMFSRWKQTVRSMRIQNEESLIAAIHSGSVIKILMIAEGFSEI
ncbi:hypothetical protein ENBRE01_1463 [Enteropsectra breve]|nr:hypothetical protein ENBRE01_1463 [Enteropsectra breve]